MYYLLMNLLVTAFLILIVYLSKRIPQVVLAVCCSVANLSYLALCLL